MIDNSNILTTGLLTSGSKNLSYYGDKINRTNTISVDLSNGERSLEIITPDGTWSYSIRYLIPGAYPGGGSVTIILNGVDITLNVPADQGLNLLYEKPGQPYITAKDEIIIANNLLVRAVFFINFERVMFNNQ